MLYVPLLFYLFDRLKEGKEAPEAAAPPASEAPPATRPGR
jgi:hypothetical protein